MRLPAPLQTFDRVNNSSANSVRPAKGEWLALLGILGAAFLLNLLTCGMYPSVWMDEVCFSEPAINLVRTGHFTTSVWQLEPANAFWAVNSPLYPFAISVWLRLTGFSLLAVRSFNYFLITIAALLVWTISWRFQLVKERSVRLIMVALILLGYGISFAYRCSRPDISGLISVLALALALANQNKWRRITLVFLCAATTAWIGVQISLYACCAVFLAMMAFRNVTWRDVLLVGIGTGAGFFSVVAFYKLKGVLPVFTALLHQAATEHQLFGNKASYAASVPRRLEFSLLSYIGDFSAVPLLICIIIAFCFRRSLFANGKALVYLLALFFIIPVVFSFTGHFAFYYSELIFVPLVLTFSALYSEAVGAAGQPILKRLFFPVCAAASAAVGLPIRLLLCAVFVHLTPRNVQQDIVRAHVHSDDVVFSDYASFFEAKQVAQTVFVPVYSTNFARISLQGHEFTPEEKKEITVLIVDPQSITTMQDYFGGRWKATSEPFGDETSLGSAVKVPIIGPRLRSHFEKPQMYWHKMQIFRREPVQQ
jgi:hypothetical protein